MMIKKTVVKIFLGLFVIIAMANHFGMVAGDKGQTIIISGR